jgi:hypothetical protein
MTAFRVWVRAALVVQAPQRFAFLVVGQDSFGHSDVYASEDHQRIVLLLPNVERRKWSRCNMGFAASLALLFSRVVNCCCSLLDATCGFC